VQFLLGLTGLALSCGLFCGACLPSRGAALTGLALKYGMFCGACLPSWWTACTERNTRLSRHQDELIHIGVLVKLEDVFCGSRPFNIFDARCDGPDSVVRLRYAHTDAAICKEQVSSKTIVTDWRAMILVIPGPGLA